MRRDAADKLRRVPWSCNGASAVGREVLQRAGGKAYVANPFPRWSSSVGGRFRPEHRKAQPVTLPASDEPLSPHKPRATHQETNSSHRTFGRAPRREGAES